eukprot:3570802-Rhodomonas_salina.1
MPSVGKAARGGRTPRGTASAPLQREENAPTLPPGAAILGWNASMPTPPSQPVWRNVRQRAAGRARSAACGRGQSAPTQQAVAARAASACSRASTTPSVASNAPSGRAGTVSTSAAGRPATAAGSRESVATRRWGWRASSKARGSGSAAKVAPRGRDGRATSVRWKCTRSAARRGRRRPRAAGRESAGRRTGGSRGARSRARKARAGSARCARSRREESARTLRAGAVRRAQRVSGRTPSTASAGQT